MYYEKTYSEPPKHTFSFSHTLFAVFSIFLGIFYGRSVFLTDAVRTIVFTFLFISAALCYFKVNSIKTNRDVHIFSAFTLLLSFRPLFFESNDVIWFIWILCLHAAAVFCVTSAGDAPVSDNIPISSVKAFFPFRVFHTLPLALLNPFTNSKRGKRLGSSMLFILIGVSISLPILLIVCMLLLKDALFMNFFSSFVKGLAKFFSQFNLLNYINPLTLIMMFFIFALLYNTGQEKPDFNLSSVEIPVLLPSTIMFLLNLCYVIFFISQLIGFLPLISGNLPQNTSIATLARSGFFDLCIVCVINGIVLYLANAFHHNSTNSKLIKVLSVILIVATILIVITSFSKMLFYIISYGFTPKRFYTIWFMLLLFITFILSLVKIKKPVFPLSRVATYITAVMLAVLFFVDYSQLSHALNSLR